MPPPNLRTSICDLLGIDYPILQSGMGKVAGPELVAAVSNAGGLGILAGLGQTADQVRSQIRRVRELTNRPFGVNLWLHAELRPPADVAALPAATIRAVQTILNRFRKRLGIPTTVARPAPMPDLIDEALETILEERIAVWSIGLGNPDGSMVARCHAAGVQVMAMVTTVEDAVTVAASGVDIIVAQGGEAGGHRSTWVRRPPHEANVGTITLVPQIVDAVRVPVIAAGGLADGRGLIAALALGACGILLGTRFVATKESMAPELWQRTILDWGSDATVVSDAFTGLSARTFRNRFSHEYEQSGAPVLPSLLQANAAQDIYLAALEQGSPDYFPLMAGQSAGLITDRPSAGDVMRSIIGEAQQVLKGLSSR